MESTSIIQNENSKTLNSEITNMKNKHEIAIDESMVTYFSPMIAMMISMLSDKTVEK